MQPHGAGYGQQQLTGEQWEGLLDTVVQPNLAQQQQQQHGNILHALHRLNRGQRAAARASTRHLSLSRYLQGRSKAQRLAASYNDNPPAALAAAAAVPAIPWGLLASAASLTSLDMSGCQLEALAAGPPQQVAPSPLERLRRLRVTGIQQQQHLGHLGWVLGASTQLTKLQLGMADAGQSSESDASLSTGALPEGSLSEDSTSEGSLSEDSTPPPPPPPSAAAALLASNMFAAGPLPALQHLEVSGSCPGLLDLWLGPPEAAGRLTALHLMHDRTVAAGFGGLAACSNLRELVVLRADGAAPLQLPHQLSQLPALTRLVLGAPSAVPPVVWACTQLRHLGITDQSIHSQLPEAISSLQQLQQLDLSQVKMLAGLQEDLGIWLPRLVSLDATQAVLRALPTTLVRLTHLAAYLIDDAASLAPMVLLKQLRLARGRLRGFDRVLAGLTALQTLDLDLAEERGWSTLSNTETLGPLPHLRSLRLAGAVITPITKHLHTLGAPQLTHLAIDSPCEWAHVKAMGVLPQLQQLRLHRPSLCPEAAWLQQQPSLTSLRVTVADVRGPMFDLLGNMYGRRPNNGQDLGGGGDGRPHIEAAWLQALPVQLVELDLFKSTLPATGGWEGLSRLVNLRTLGLAEVRTGDSHHRLERVQQRPVAPWLASLHVLERPLPPWLPSLVHLEVLDVRNWVAAAGWEVLGRLPLLRCVKVSPQVEAAALQHVPHLCWDK